MMQDIERIHYLRDDQIPKTMYYRAIHKKFRAEDARCGIVSVDGPSLVILDREDKFYLIFRNGSRELLQQIQELLKQVSISMYMEVPLRKTESIIDEEDFIPPKTEQKLLKITKKTKEK